MIRATWIRTTAWDWRSSTSAISKSSLREYREAKRLAPGRYDVRQNLGAGLMNHGFPADAVVEIRELEKLYPDAEMCHESLGMALYRSWDLKGADAEFRLAAQLDPSDAAPHVGLGEVLETEEQDDDACWNSAAPRDSIIAPSARITARAACCSAKRTTAAALSELQQSEELAPGNSSVHDLYAQALEASGNIDGAISEFKQAVALHPSDPQVAVKLAAALEKKGDWVAAIDEYHKAALLDASIDLRSKVIRADDPVPEAEYEKAQARLKEHIAALKAAGKASEAAELESRVRAAEAAPSLSEKLDAAMQAGARANSQRHFDEALQDYKQAVDIADKMQPHDERLVTALDDLGNEYFGRDPADAEAAYERELKVAQELFGPQSANLAAHCNPWAATR